MLRSARGLVGFTIGAIDGDIGNVETLYFDDEHWTVRYFVVDTSWWLSGRRVLISPVSVRQPDWDAQRLPVAFTKSQVEASPDVDTHRPISRQFEAAFSQYYGVPTYWPSAHGSGVEPPMPDPLARELQARVEEQNVQDRHLHGLEEVLGNRLRALDGELGHVADFPVEDLTWRIRYMEVDTRNWWPGKRVLVAPEWIAEVSWSRGRVDVALPRDTIRDAPEYDRSRPIDRAYEHRLYAYYGSAGYWDERAAA